MSRAAASRAVAAAGPSSPTPRPPTRPRVRWLSPAAAEERRRRRRGREGRSGGGRCWTRSSQPATAAPPDLLEGGLAALDESRRDIGRVVDFFADLDVHESGIVTRSQFRKAMPLLTFAQPSAAKCKRDMDALFDALDTDGVGLVSYKELPQVLESRAASAAARSAPRSRRRAAPPAALLSPTGKVAVPSEPAS